MTRASLWPNQRDWKKAEQLWTQAAERKHWKAMMNLASLYETGQGKGALAVPEDSYKAIDIVEAAMKLGIPAAYDKMGNYHSRGMPSIRPDGSRAWAFWERAADMGNPQALTHIGKALAATYDNPEPNHPQVGVVNAWWRQAFIEQGTPMPDARAWGMAGEGRIMWQLLEPGAWTMDLPA